MRYAQQIDNSADSLVNYVDYSLWTMVKAGQRRVDDATHFGDTSHVA